MRVIQAKLMFVIEGVAARKTSRIVEKVLTSRLDFACYVQVVTNYVLAFDLAMQQDFDAIVLPRNKAIGDFSKKDFVEMVANVDDFSSHFVHTVDRDCVFHIHGTTVRSTESDGYVVDDLVAVIASVVGKSVAKTNIENPLNRGSSAISTISGSEPKKSKKRDRSEAETTSESASMSPRQKQRASLTARAPPCLMSAQEAAYQQYCYWQWQWQMYYYHAQAQAHTRFIPASPLHPPLVHYPSSLDHVDHRHHAYFPPQQGRHPKEPPRNSCGNNCTHTIQCTASEVRVQGTERTCTAAVAAAGPDSCASSSCSSSSTCITAAESVDSTYSAEGGDSSASHSDVIDNDFDGCFDDALWACIDTTF